MDFDRAPWQDSPGSRAEAEEYTCLVCFQHVFNHSWDDTQLLSYFLGGGWKHDKPCSRYFMPFPKGWSVMTAMVLSSSLSLIATKVSGNLLIRLKHGPSKLVLLVMLIYLDQLKHSFSGVINIEPCHAGSHLSTHPVCHVSGHLDVCKVWLRVWVDWHVGSLC